ncbi:MAG TPA: hypothetical protein GXZ35_01765 [Acholeplasmataceae bacterium]|nr:hypothetical protein [Acholeplasmataceae bacterium]
MSKKNLELLKISIMTQNQLAFEIYGDNLHWRNIYGALMSLVKEGYVIRTGRNPSFYSISGLGFVLPVKAKKAKKDKSRIDVVITNDLIEEAHQQVKKTDNYGKEDELISDSFEDFLKMMM